jgi:hypothetical protein
MRVSELRIGVTVNADGTAWNCPAAYPSRTLETLGARIGAGDGRTACRAVFMAESAVSTHHEPPRIHCRAASTCPAGKCLISAETKCDVKCSATSPILESVTTATFLMRL